MVSQPPDSSASGPASPGYPPEVLEKSEVSFTASDVAVAVKRDDVAAWFAHRVAERYCRNKSHNDLISRLANISRSGVRKQHGSEIEEWLRWVLVRNSIVHLGGESSQDLTRSWPERFPRPGDIIQLTGSEISQAAHVSRLLVEVLDQRLLATIVKESDQELLAQEVFIRHGVVSPARLVPHVNSVLNSSMSRSSVERALARHRRNPQPTSGFTFLDEMVQPK